jgi:hypothetical protein
MTSERSVSKLSISYESVNIFKSEWESYLLKSNSMWDLEISTIESLKWFSEE